MLHAVLAGQGAHQRRAAVRGADGGARLQHTSHHASIPTIQLPQLRRRMATCRLREYNLLFSGGRRIVIFPGHVVVMAGPAAVIAKEVRKEISGNNKPSAKKKIPSTAAATQAAQRGPVKRNQSTLWNPLFLSRSQTAAAAIMVQLARVVLQQTHSSCGSPSVPVVSKRNKKNNLDCTMFLFFPP